MGCPANSMGQRVEGPEEISASLVADQVDIPRGREVMIERQVRVTHEVGLHARPAAMFVQAACKFNAQIRVRNLTAGGQSANAKSILMVLALAVTKDQEIEIQAEGPDEESAVMALCQLVQDNFAETKKQRRR